MNSIARDPKEKWQTIIRYLLLSLMVYLFLLPFLFMLSSSLKTFAETLNRVSANPFSPWFWPKSPQWENYRIVIFEGEMLRYFLNSVIITVITVFMQTATTLLAGFGFAKLRFPGRDIFFVLILATLMVPETVLTIPNYLIITSLGLINTLLGVTLPFFASALFIFFSRQFFRQIPDTLIEAAHINGANNFAIFRRVCLPLMRAPTATILFLSMFQAWNSLQWPLLVTNNDVWRPLTVAITNYNNEAGPEIQLRMAAALVALLPVILLYMINQKQIAEAVSHSGIKG